MKFFKKLFCILAIVSVLFCCTTSLTSCTDRDAARDVIFSFLTYVNEFDFVRAQACLHPDRIVDVREFFNDLEYKEDIEFQNEMLDLEFYGNTYSFYDSDYDGSSYGTTVFVKFGKVNTTMNFTVVQNEAGYGIYYFDVKITE